MTNGIKVVGAFIYHLIDSHTLGYYFALFAFTPLIFNRYNVYKSVHKLHSETTHKLLAYF